MLQVNELTGFGAFGNNPGISLAGTAAETSSASGLYDFGTVSFGEENASRLIVVLVSITDATSSPVSFSSASIGGITATLIAEANDDSLDQFYSAIFCAHVPSGTSGNISIQLSSSTTGSNGFIAAYRAIDLNSHQPFDTDGAIAASGIDLTVNVSDGGVVFTCSNVNESNDSFATSGFTRDFDELVLGTEVVSWATGGTSKDLPAQSRQISYDVGLGSGVAASFR